MDPVAQAAVTLFFAIAGSLLIVPATLIHPVVGRVVLVFACFFMLVGGFTPGYSMLGSLLTILIYVGVHGAVADARAAKPTDPHRSPPPRAVRPAEPPARSAARDHAGVMACPGCGAAERALGRCAYCGRQLA
ncbi:MAG: hypothetical protein KY467_14825 [Gemmatimonadetes bacterium]|nr:hypothetical protein [Gemmatimonadota bacterium]